MAYTIETGIPIPASAKAGFSPRPARTPLRLELDALEVGQSFLTDTQEEYRRARSLITHIGNKRFVTRKCGGEGWRIWRVE